MLHPLVLIPDPLLNSSRATMFESDRVCDLSEKEQAGEPAKTGLKS